MPTFSEVLEMAERQRDEAAQQSIDDQSQSPFGQTVEKAERAQAEQLTPSGAVIETALGRNPDQEAKHQSMAAESGYPVEAVREKSDVFEKRKKGDDLRKALGSLNYTSEWFSNPENASIAHDDVERMGYMENIAMGIGERVGGSGRGAENVLNVLSKGPLDPIAQALGFDSSEIPGLGTASVNAVRVLQGKKFRSATDYQPLDYGYEEGTSIDDLIDQPFMNVLPFALEQGLVSLPDMALAMINMPTFAASMTGRVAEDRTKNDGRTDVTLGDVIAAAPLAVGSAFLERAGARGILGVGSQNAVKKAGVAAVAKATGKAGVQEALTEGAQEGLESLGGSVGTERGFDGGETLKSMLGGAVGGGVFGSGLRGSTEATKALMKKSGEVWHARSLAKATAEMNAVDAKLRERDPQKYAEFKGGLLRRNGVDEVSITADALREFQQSGGDMTWAGSLGFMEDGRFDTALVVGGDVALTPEEFAMVPAEVHTVLIENIRFNGEMTLKEATEFEESGLQTELQRIVDSTSGPEVEGRRDFDAIQTEVENQLLTAGRGTDEATYGGILMAQRYNVRAARTGENPLDLYRADSLAIVGPDGQKQAPVDDLSLALDALRSDADMQKVMRLQGSTVLEEVIARGGLSPNGAFAAELAARGITPKNARGLFKEDGASVLENIPASEIPFFAEQITEEGAYIPEQALLDAIEQEVTGGQNLTAEQEQDLTARSDYLDEIRGAVERAGLTLENTEAEIRAALDGRQFEQAPSEDSDAFKAWAGTETILDPDEVNYHDFQSGEAVVMRAYHGTTHDFEAFDASKTGNKEGQFGAVNYFTTSEGDANGNYAGEGPDLSQRIELRAEQLEANDEAEGDAALAQARSELSGGKPKTLEVFIRTENPFVVGEGSPWAEFIDTEALEASAVKLVAENNEIEVSEVQERRDEFEDEIDEARWEVEGETENPLITAIQTVADRYGVEASGIFESVTDFHTDGGRHAELEAVLRSSEGLAYAEDAETGDLAGYHMLGEIIQELGFDSIILKEAGDRFESMSIDPGTAHIHVFDANNSNIKSVENKGTFDAADPRILFQEGLPDVSDDVRASVLENSTLGLKVGKKAKFWRGVNETSGGNSSEYGTGLYLTASKSEAQSYVDEGGRLIEMDHSDLPSNPLRFKNHLEYQMWLQHAQDLMGLRGMRQWGPAFPDLRGFVQLIDPEIDGVQVGTGKDAIFVNYDGAKVFEQPERGSIQFSNQKILINLGANADQTTFLHETGHLFLEQLSDDSLGSEELAADWKTVKDWWGKNAESLRAEAISYAKKQKDTESVAALEGMSKASVAAYVKTGDLSRGAGAEGHLSRAMHEQWARGTEDYFRTGRAPSINLQSAFNHFRAWLVSIYSAAKRRLGKDALDSKFSPEVQKVMDRLLATDEEIKTIEEQYDLQALFGSAEEIGMTPSQFKEYQKAISESVEEAKTKQLKKHLNEVERARQKWWLDEKEAMRPDVEDEVAKNPSYQAMHGLALGSTPQGEALDRVPSRLNKADVIELMGSSEALKRLPRVGGRAVYTTAKKEGGIDPEIIAGVYGFGSAHEMLLDFANITPFDEAVEVELEARMKEKHGDMTIPEQALEEALESTRNNKRGDVLAAELNALSEGKEKVKPAFVREAAKTEIGKNKVGEIQPGKFVNAERRQGKEAGKALKRGDRVGAMRAKFRQMMNFFLSHEAYKARIEVDKSVKYLKKFGKRGAKFATIDADYIDQIKGILENYNLAPRLSDKKRKSLMVWAAKEADEKGVALEIPDVIQRADGTTNYKDLTLDEFRTLVDTVKNIETTGRRLKKVKVGNKTMDIQVAVDGVVSNIEANLSDKKRTLETSTKLEKISRNIKGFGYLLVNPDTTLRELDGWQNLGAAYTSIKAGIDTAIASVYIPRQMEQAVTQKEIYDRHYTKKERLEFWVPHAVPGTDFSLSKQARLSVALNSGNADNKAALVDSGQFTEQEVEAVLQTLDERDWKFAQDNWDYIDTFWTEIAAAERERHGVAPTKVAGVPVETKFGTVDGGYYPLKYDKNASILAGQEQAKDAMKQLSAGHFAAKQTSKGHTKERTSSGGRAVLLDLGVIPMHVDNVIYDLSLSDPINDANRILNHKDTRAAFEKKGHLAAYEQLNMWLEDVASGEMRRGDAIEVIMRHLRVGFTTSKLAWNVSTAMLQPLGILQTAALIGKRNTARGVFKMLSHPWVGENSIFKMVAMQSDLMKIRDDTYNKDITDAHRLLTEGLLSKVLPDPVVKFFDTSLFFMMTKMQRMVDVATWLGAQQQGLEEFDGDIEKANFHADRMVVRAQASGIFTDRTSIERGSVSSGIRQTETVRAFTALISYFMAKNNVALERFKKTNYKNPLEIANLAIDMVLMYAVEAVLVGLIRGQFPDGDEDDALDKVGFAGKEALNTLLAGIPLVRDFASAANGFSGGGVIGAVSNEGGSLVKQLAQGEFDAPLVKSVVRLGGSLFKLPSSQPIKTGSAIAKALAGEEVEFIEYLMGPKYN